MKTKTPLQALMDKYKDYPDFFGKRLIDPKTRGYTGDNLLHLVARIGTLEEVYLLVDTHVSVNSIGDMGFTPLHYAAGRGNLDMVKYLLELGADFTILNNFGATAAETAENLEHPEIAVFLRNLNK